MTHPTDLPPEPPPADDGRPRALYVHVPFCQRRCFYCDFAVTPTRRAPTDEWLDAVVGEMRLMAEEQGWDAPLALDSVYVGGGTPSMLAPGALAAFRDRIAPYALWSDGAEWTVEANPESFTAALAADWAGAGVGRLSLGVQTFHAPALRWMGRLHGPDGPARAMDAARDAGFGNVSVDLIFALPEKLGRSWEADLHGALLLEPEHVSLYGLTAESGAPLGRRVREGTEALPPEERYADEYLTAHRWLTGAGFAHYEVSNFGRTGRRSRHNGVYWKGAPYAALGPGAHAFLPPERRWNVRRWEAYREAVAAGRLPVEDRETVGGEAAALEHAWLGLRTDAGVPLADAPPAAVALAGEWEARGWATTAGGVLRLTADGWLLLDALAVKLADAWGDAVLPG